MKKASIGKAHSYLKCKETITNENGPRLRQQTKALKEE